jgi:hypothetical protein
MLLSTSNVGSVWHYMHIIHSQLDEYSSTRGIAGLLLGDPSMTPSTCFGLQSAVPARACPSQPRATAATLAENAASGTWLTHPLVQQQDSSDALRS